MADTRILPSPLSGGLTRGAQGFVDAREKNRLFELNKREATRKEAADTLQADRLEIELSRLALEERRVKVLEAGSKSDIELAGNEDVRAETRIGFERSRVRQGDRQLTQTDRQLTQRDRGLSLEATRTATQTQAEAFRRLIQFAPLMTPGSTLGDNIWILDTAREAFGDLSDAEFEAIKSMELNRETIATLMDDRARQYVANLDISIPENAALLERLDLTVLGFQGQTRAGLALDDKVIGLTANLFEALEVDPTMQGKIVASRLGIDPTVTIPNLLDDEGEMIVHDSQAAANTYAAVANNRLNNFSEQLSLNAVSSLEIVTRLMDQAESAGILVGQAFASRIVAAYAASVGPDAEIDDLGNRAIDALMNDPRTGPDEQRAIRMYIGTIRLGDNDYEAFLREQGPAGAAQLMLFAMGQMLSSDKGLNLPSEDMVFALEDFLDSEIGKKFGITVNSKGITVRHRFKFEEPTFDEPAPIGTPPGGRIDSRGNSIPVEAISFSGAIRGTNAPEPTVIDSTLPPESNSLIVAIANILNRPDGGMTEEQIRATYGDDAVDEAIKLNEERP